MPRPVVLVSLPSFALSLLAVCAVADDGERPPLAPRGVTPADTYELPTPAELEVSPDGRWAVYTVASPDRDADGYTYALYALDLAAADAGQAVAPKRVGRPADDASAPHFSPDGRFLAYVSDGDDGDELRIGRVTPRGIGRGEVALTVPEGLGGLAWSPDGERLVFARVDPVAEDVPDSAPWVITRSTSRRDGEGFLGDRRAHLWVVARRGGTAVQITQGPWDDGEPQWSPDGTTIAFASNRHDDPDATDDSDIYLVRPDGSALRQLPTGPGADQTPRWSHRGDRLAYLSLRRANDYYQPYRVVTIRPDGSGVTDLSGHLDAGVAADCINWSSAQAAPQWTADDSEILVTLERRGANHAVLLASSEPSATPRELLEGAAVHDLVRQRPGNAEPRLVFSRTDPTHPPELFATSADGPPRQLTHLHDAWLASRTLVTPTKVTATSTAGNTVEAWLYPPRDPQPGRRYPLIVYIHGGPQAYDGDYFDYGLENQLFPAAGWAVLRVNYRGSTSYGEAFSRAVWGDWHSREYEDLMATLDAALAQNPWLDPGRLGVGGWSYGGIMSLWTVGHTERFKVGVPERFAFDYSSSFGEDQWSVWYLSELGSPLEHPDLYRRLSPGTYTANIKTPLYLIANELDYNCPLPQVLQLYQRLKLAGQSTELVVYPGESHSMTMPSHLVDRLERLLTWFGRHLR
jgi:dipeptidyl aminopeptidase/acylaminoacyl peptidase